jgi:NAD(P)-dependent dehydrogenase (short-subunit alcohol dehydrogenase family)
MEGSRPDGHTLAGRTALVTGGTGGVGRAVVKCFLEAGAKVQVPVFAEEEIPALEGYLGDAVHAVEIHRGVDLGDPGSVETLFSALSAPPQIVANVAGGFAMAVVEETEPESWERMLRMNATTAFLVSRAAFPAMREGGFGRILNVSARPALEGGAKEMGAYGASKAAVLNLTRALAREGGPLGITANAVVPTILDTPGNRDAMPGADRSTWIPPMALARVFRFLASAEGGVVNGAAIPLEWHGG